jgi:hypothetical protein
MMRLRLQMLTPASAKCENEVKNAAVAAVLWCRIGGLA